jgi:hypothetical protein
MAKARWRSRILVVLLVLTTTIAPRVALSDEGIPPLRTKEKMQTIVISLMDIMVAPVPYVSSMPINRPFTAVGFAVRGRTNPDAQALADYARHAMEVRLEELGVSEQIHVVPSVDPIEPGWPPTGVPYCDMLSVTFAFNAAAHNVDGRSVFVIAADMIAEQPASEEDSAGEWQCMKDTPVPDGMMQVGPRVAVVGQGELAAMHQSRTLILGFIDSMIVPRIVRTNKTATETFKSWARDGN